MKIKNWAKFQHFKDRKPPWVKLYRDILDDVEWHKLDPKAAKVLVMLWLIASEDEGNIPDIESLAFRLRISEAATKEALSKLSHWMDQADIKMISARHQTDTAAVQNNSATVDLTLGETEREEEEETEGEKDICSDPQSVSEPAVVKMILVDKSEFEIAQSDIDSWSQAYPAADVMAEIYKMNSWLDANPSKRKTRIGVKKFIVAWLTKVQDNPRFQLPFAQRHGSHTGFAKKDYRTGVGDDGTFS
ncbi:hypothetical protein [Polynucleobacter sp. UK-Kesae-W10]|uniref:hypothetical protein n=1 Tax=Polynucleobacter sp. UK-Kesae-W10 TaxID=1819738 RepID=UPI001C0B6601|nr:hypothetical protein [Polynucleobacter sp. UK-Kesae-W10]MBU3577516.1 hypothetical protein [Polynucleobacter sp. UK-Kesae-W10]